MRIRVHYPLGEGRLLLRTDADWERDVAPVGTSSERTRFDFALDDEQPFHYFKPVLQRGNGPEWARGDNRLVLRGEPRPLEVFPHFAPDSRCEVCTLQQPEELTGGCSFRVFLPPGYHENPLERFPVLYMQDGQNLFFPDEAFAGRTWQIPETLSRLLSMNLLRRVLVVGIVPARREEQYTAPGYETYGRWLVERLKPWIDGNYQTLPGREHTAVMGSSLGGVVSLHLGLRWPAVFGAVGCLSSTFGWKDDLFQRVAASPALPVRVYLDSGWPGDNYEVTRGMYALLLRRGLQRGRQLLYLAHPEGRHDEGSWAARVHVPLQFFFRDEPGADGGPSSGDLAWPST